MNVMIGLLILVKLLNELERELKSIRILGNYTLQRVSSSINLRNKRRKEILYIIIDHILQIINQLHILITKSHQKQ